MAKKSSAYISKVNPSVMSIREIVQAFGIPSTTLVKWLDDGIVPCIGVERGGRYSRGMTREDALEAAALWLRERNPKSKRIAEATAANVVSIIAKQRMVQSA